MENKALEAPKKNKRIKTKTVVVLVLCAIAVAVVAVSVSIIINTIADGYTQIAGENVPIRTAQLDYRNRQLTGIDGFEKLKKPEKIDIRDNDISVEDYEKLQAQFPECFIHWSVPFGDRSLDSLSEEISVTDANVACLDNMKYLPELSRIDARTLDYDVAEYIMEMYPQALVEWEKDICGVRYPYDTESIVLTENTSAEDINALPIFKSLKSVDAANCNNCTELLEVSALMSDCDFTWTATIGGIEIDNKTEKLDFARKKVTDIASLDEEFKQLVYFPNIKEVDMCGCGVSSAQMAKWREQYPDNKFVWEIRFGDGRRKWTVRTDIQVFSTLLGDDLRYVGDQYTYAGLFKYCTDLVALDLGHNRLTSLKFITGLKKLQGLVITDNQVKDLSPLKELPNLVFLEANLNNIYDITPLAECENLIHVDFYSNHVSDLKPLYGLKNLKTICCADNRLEQKDLNKIREAMKGITISKLHTNIGRNDKVRSEFRLALKNYDQVVQFNSYDDVVYKDGAKLTYPKGYTKYD